MRFPDLTIETTDDDKKARSFTVHRVAHLITNTSGPHDRSRPDRPWLLAYAASTSAARAFTANLRCGGAAKCMGARYELLRSLPYRYRVSSPTPGASLVVAYLPEILHLQPGAFDRGSNVLAFVSAPPLWWLDRQEKQLADELGDDARDYARAMAFVSRLDTRTPLPITNSPDFHLALYRRALEEPWTTLGYEDRKKLDTVGFGDLGLDEPLLCYVSAAEFEHFLADTTTRLLPRHVRPRPEAPSLPVVPPPTFDSSAGVQLGLGF